MFDIFIERLDTHTKQVLAQILQTEGNLMTKFEELQGAFAAMLEANAQFRADVLAKLQTAIDNSGADSSHFDDLIAQVNGETAAANQADAALKADPAAPVVVDPADPVAPITVPGATVDPITGTDPAAPAASATE